MNVNNLLQTVNFVTLLCVRIQKSNLIWIYFHTSYYMRAAAMTTQFPSAMNKVSLILSLASGISDTQLKFCDLEASEYGRKAGSFLNSIHAVTSK